MLKIAIKYCGGCNPDYDRVAVVHKIVKRLAGKAVFVSSQDADFDLLLVIEGCSVACADLSSLNGKKNYKISCREDAETFIQALSGGLAAADADFF